MIKKVYAIAKLSNIYNTYSAFLIGLVQTQWNFHPKSIYKSLSTIWNIVPITCLPSGSPSYKRNSHEK